MAKTVINPKDTTSVLYLDDAIQEIQSGVGFLKNSGLFVENTTPNDTIVEQINKESKRGMLGLTNRREREKVKQTRRRQDMLLVQLPYQETIEEVTKEDVHQVAKSWDDLTPAQAEDIYIEKMTAQRESIDASHEYIVWTAAQGQTKDPFDGSVVLDMFTQKGITRPVVTVDLTAQNFDVLAWMSEFRNRVVRDNKRAGVLGVVEIMVAQDVFSAITRHPSVRAAYQFGWQTRGQEYIDKLANNGRVVRGDYGIVSEFEENGVRFVVAPQTFILEDTGLEDVAVEDGKGFVITRGLRDVYKMFYGQNNSMTDNTLAKIYARRSPIIDDAYFELTASSAPMAYTTAPELAYELEFTLA